MGDCFRLSAIPPPSSIKAYTDNISDTETKRTQASEPVLELLRASVCRMVNKCCIVVVAVVNKKRGSYFSILKTLPNNILPLFIPVMASFSISFVS